MGCKGSFMSNVYTSFKSLATSTHSEFLFSEMAKQMYLLMAAGSTKPSL